MFILFFMNSSFGKTTCSKYAEKQYVLENNVDNAHIVVKKEHTEEYPQVLKENVIKAITYGYGDMKIRGCKKFRISYICLLDENCKPFWSYIINIE